MSNKVTSLISKRSNADANDKLRPAWPAWPTYGLTDDLLPVLEDWHAQGRHAALATLVGIEGSSPRPLGSEMAISDTGEVAGYLSGGCVEAEVASQAAQVLKHGEPIMLDYGVGSPVLDVQLTCGGRIGIFVRALNDLGDYVNRMRSAREARQTLDVHIDLAIGTHRYASPGPINDAPLAPSLANTRIFRQRHTPRPRLVIVGSDPVTLALCQTAGHFGYEVTLLRPYGPSAPPPNCRLVYYDTRALATALRDLQLDAFTAVYTLTHDLDDDQAVLVKALASPAFSIGALGSRRKAAKRAAGLRAQGITDDQISRLSTPAGLDIGANTPREIALSIMAELVTRQPRAAAQAL